MESKVKVLGHSAHQMLIVFPMGLLSLGVIFDIVYFLTGRQAVFAGVGFWDVTAGLIGGGIAAAVGWMDWFAIPEGTRAKAVGALHGRGNMLVLALFLVSWILRLSAYQRHASVLPLILEVVGVAVLGATGWLGGELVDRLGMGVDPMANLNAPSSIPLGPLGGDKPSTPLHP